MKASEVLKAARALIDTPEKWTKGNYARDESGRPTPYESDGACQFCAVGAVKRAAMPADLSAAWRAEDLLSDTAWGMYNMTIVSFNDRADTKHAQVLKVYDKAIKVAEWEEAAKEA